MLAGMAALLALVYCVTPYSAGGPEGFPIFTSANARYNTPALIAAAGLLGWAALLVHPAAGATLLIAGFLTQYRQDLRLTRVLTLPAWYLPLRLQLTVVACLCLASLYFLEQALPSAAMSV